MHRKIVIVDDHPLVRSGIAVALRASDEVTVVGEAEDARSAYLLVDSLAPDLVVLDLMLPAEDGITAAREIRRRRAATRILLLSGYVRPDLAAYAIEAGADGVVLKSQPAEDLRAAVQIVLSGGRYLAPDLDADAVDHLMAQRARGEGMAPLDVLSARERDVFTLQARGLSAKEIARELFISEKTVQTHRARIFRKLNVHSGVELVRFAAEHGLLPSATSSVRT
jgi:DNA-binding NarL/FixJ family response regulator